jgi:hypothetical protein
VDSRPANGFMHRLRTTEGKDGNPLNEMRVVCSPLMLNDGVPAADRGIAPTPQRSILGYAPGDRIALTEPSLLCLAGACFAEIEITCLQS